MSVVVVVLATSLAASAYPAGAAVSTGSNPVFSAAGNFGLDSSAEVITAPAEHDLVVTDVIVSVTAPVCRLSAAISLELAGSSEQLAAFALNLPYVHNDTGLHSLHFESGLRIPQGQVLHISMPTRVYTECSTSSYRVYYTVSGYAAQP
jgi:hypothetical protein